MHLRCKFQNVIEQALVGHRIDSTNFYQINDLFSVVSTVDMPVSSAIPWRGSLPNFPLLGGDTQIMKVKKLSLWARDHIEQHEITMNLTVLYTS